MGTAKKIYSPESIEHVEDMAAVVMTECTTAMKLGVKATVFDKCFGTRSNDKMLCIKPTVKLRHVARFMKVH